MRTTTKPHEQPLRDTKRLTNGTDNGRATVVLCGHIFGVELRGPLKLHAVGQVIQGVRHRCAVGALEWILRGLGPFEARGIKDEGVSDEDDLRIKLRRRKKRKRRQRRRMKKEEKTESKRNISSTASATEEKKIWKKMQKKIICWGIVFSGGLIRGRGEKKIHR